MSVSRYLQIAFLVSLILAISISGSARSVTAVSSTPTFVLGVTNPLDPLIVDLQSLTSSVTILGSVSSLTLVGGNSILFVDGSWLATASSIDPTVLSLVAAEPLAGVPTVTIRGNPALLSTSITGLLRWHIPDLPLISEGLKVAGSLPDGTKKAAILQIVSGFDYAVQQEFNWGQQQLALGLAIAPGSTPTVAPAATPATTKTISPSVSSTAPAAYWDRVAFVSIDTGDGYKPYGRIITTASGYILENGGSNTYGWYNFFFNTTVQPGIMLWKDSNFRTSSQYTLVHVLNTTSTALVDHGPIGLNNAGPFVVSYSIGVTAGQMAAVVNATQSQSYFLKNTNVTDTTKPLNNATDISWYHNVDARTNAGSLTFQIIPGWTPRYLLSAHDPNFEVGLTTTFVQLSGNSIVGSKSITFGQFPG